MKSEVSQLEIGETYFFGGDVSFFDNRKWGDNDPRTITDIKDDIVYWSGRFGNKGATVGDAFISWIKGRFYDGFQPKRRKPA